MGAKIGRLIQFGIARETTRGTAESSATYWIPADDLAVDDKDERILDDQSRGVIEGSVGESIIKQFSEVTLKGPIGDKFFPLVLYGTLGTLSTGDNADSDASVKDHTISVGQSAQHQALTLFVDDPGVQDYKHALGVVTGLEINYERGRFINFSASFKAKKGATATLTPSATSSESRFRPHHVTFKIASSQAGLDAASAVSIKSAQIKFNPNVEDDVVLGSIAPNDFYNKDFRVEGTIEATWLDEASFKTAALAATVKALRLDLVNTDVTIGNAANPRIKIDLYAVTFKPITRAIKLNDIVTQTVQFTAHYSTSDSKMVEALATNVVASY